MALETKSSKKLCNSYSTCFEILDMISFDSENPKYTMLVYSNKFLISCVCNFWGESLTSYKGLGIQNRGWVSLATQLNNAYFIMNYTCLQVWPRLVLSPNT
jgi:hypothetical protein